MKITSPEHLKDVMKFHKFTFVDYSVVRKLARGLKAKSIQVKAKDNATG